MDELTTILFTRKDSIYLELGCDRWDMERDARMYRGADPVIAHPPCRAWGRLRGFAKPRADEKDLARLAIDIIRKNGGVLEHPATSTLWIDREMPRPGSPADVWGGWTLSVDQFWMGHKARKRTWLYIVGIGPSEIPDYPLKMDAIEYWVGGPHKSKSKKLITKSEREETPVEFAKYLISIINAIKQKNGYDQKKSDVDGADCEVPGLAG
jgi:hypothetical protein